MIRNNDDPLSTKVVRSYFKEFSEKNNNITFDKFIDINVSDSDFSFFNDGKYIKAKINKALLWVIFIINIILTTNYVFDSEFKLSIGFIIGVSLVINLSLISMIISVFRKKPAPVRFHREKQVVYILHKKSFYEIPWSLNLFQLKKAKRLEQSPSRSLYFIDTYELLMFLPSKYAQTKKTEKIWFSLCYAEGDEGMSLMQGYANYIKRYMEYSQQYYSFNYYNVIDDFSEKNKDEEKKKNKVKKNNSSLFNRIWTKKTFLILLVISPCVIAVSYIVLCIPSVIYVMLLGFINVKINKANDHVNKDILNHLVEKSYFI